MKQSIKLIVCVLLAIVCLFNFTACNKDAEKNGENSGETGGIWENAKYSKDAELGEGEKTVVVEVKAEDKKVTFTIKTDEKTVGAALAEHELIDGDDGEFGLYVKVVNGITADYDVDKSYWAFYVDGEYATSGVDTTEIKEGVTYQLVYTK